MTLAHKKRVAGRRASGQRNLHKKTFIIANINWCRRRRLRARCAQFDISLSLARSSYPTRLNNDGEEKWKLSHCSISRCCLYWYGEIDAQKEKLLRRWNPKISSPFISVLCFRKAHKLPCMPSWVEQSAWSVTAHEPTDFREHRAARITSECFQAIFNFPLPFIGRFGFFLSGPLFAKCALLLPFHDLINILIGAF